jgi:hypothetical protein
MPIEERVRALLGPADPARGSAADLPALTAHDLIVRAEAATGPAAGLTPRARVSRRALVTGAAGAAVLGTAGTVWATRPTGPRHRPRSAGSPTAAPASASPAPPRLGPVARPVQYEIETGAGPAGDQLRALADRITDAPYDQHTGRYAYHRVKLWGEPESVSPDGRYVMSTVSVVETWEMADGSGRQRSTPLPPEFPDDASRAWWLTQPYLPDGPATTDLPRQPVTPLPTDATGLADLLDTAYGASAVAEQLSRINYKYVVPRATRAGLLRVLADIPDFVWRGHATDQAGRTGLAISGDDLPHGERNLLIFDPATGGLLAHQLSFIGSNLLKVYELVLATDRTDQPG